MVGVDVVFQTAGFEESRGCCTNILLLPVHGYRIEDN